MEKWAKKGQFLSLKKHANRLHTNTAQIVILSAFHKLSQQKMESATNAETSQQPAWKDTNGLWHFDIPKELRGLHEAEKQSEMMSLCAPLVHTKNGTLGLKGHVCSFPQALKDVIVETPCKPSDVDMVRMMRSCTGKEGNQKCKHFMVRKSNVFGALHWLVQHNDECKKCVKTVKGNLEWMDGDEEAELPGVHDLEGGGPITAEKSSVSQQCDPDSEMERVFRLFEH